MTIYTPTAFNNGERCELPPTKGNPGDVLRFAGDGTSYADQLGTLADQDSDALNVSSVVLLTGLPTAVNPSDAVPYSQVQMMVATGTRTYGDVDAAFNTNVSISSPGALTDGTFSVGNGDRILLLNQTTASQNGPWVYNGSSSALTRPLDYAHGAVVSGIVYAVDGAGSAYSGYSYALNTDPVTVDTTAASWGVFSTKIFGSSTITVSAGVVSIDLSHANTWTGTQTVQKDSIGTTPTDGVVLINGTASGPGANQNSPQAHFSGHYDNSGDRTIDYWIGTSGDKLVVYFRDNGGAVTPVMTLGTNSYLSVPNAAFSSGVTIGELIVTSAVAFFGASPTTQPSGDIGSALVTLGLIGDSPTLAASKLTGGTFGAGVGFAPTDYDGTTISSGTYTPSHTNGNSQYITNGGSFTLACPSASCSIVLEITNNGSAGTITTSGFSKVSGDSFDTTNGHAWQCTITKTKNKSTLVVQACQ